MLHEHDSITLGKGSYRLRRQLAHSAYGVVWHARAPAGLPDVALKLINRSQMARADPALQDRWVTSANTEIGFLRQLAAWDQRHIVRLLDSGIHQDLPVMALELLGQDLGRRAGNKPIAFEQALDWLGQVNQALAKVHQHGWLYLDLKPANVLLERDGTSVKLADFGTSRLRSSLPAGTYAGTASWQAPEQFFPTPQHTYATDMRSDYFALGALFYYLVTGGSQLRFCTACGDAWRAHQARGAAILAADGMPATVHEDEAEQFEYTVAQQAGGMAADAALRLLRTLLASLPAHRPQHAVEISRLLAAVRAPAWPRRAVPHIARARQLAARAA